MSSLFTDKSIVESRLHFVGIGGISMSSLAILAKRSGYSVSGSDRNASQLTERCEEEGIDVEIGHNAKNVEGSDAVIYTAAIPHDSPELARARELGIPLISRSDFLGGIMENYRTRIGISGTHGKTTTTSMISHIFIEAGLDPTVANGAVTKELNGALRIGSHNNFIYEACEYKDSFLSFSPSIAVITNIELDHTDYYSSLEAVVKSFGKSLEPAQIAVVNIDDKNVGKAIKGFAGRVVTVSTEDESAGFFASDIRYEKGCGVYKLKVNGNEAAEIRLPVIGRFNVYNSLCAAAVACTCNIDVKTVANALSSFVQAKRRFEIKSVINEITIADDYAHHPSEIAATLDGLKNTGAKRIICIFQPHTYSRTHDLFDNFASALSKADITVLADIYAARETETLGVSSEMLAGRIPDAKYFPSFGEIAEYTASIAEKGDLILTMGAGDVYKIGDIIAEKLRKK